MSGPRMNMSQMNGNGRSRPQGMSRTQSATVERPSCAAHHEDLIRYIHESWNQVSQELDKTAVYYHDQENHNLRNFEPFDLEGYWGRRVVQQSQNS